MTNKCRWEERIYTAYDGDKITYWESSCRCQSGGKPTKELCPYCGKPIEWKEDKDADKK